MKTMGEIAARLGEAPAWTLVESVTIDTGGGAEPVRVAARDFAAAAMPEGDFTLRLDVRASRLGRTLERG